MDNNLIKRNILGFIESIDGPVDVRFEYADGDVGFSEGCDHKEAMLDVQLMEEPCIVTYLISDRLIAAAFFDGANWVRFQMGE